jgi:hypothetical protein
LGVVDISAESNASIQDLSDPSLVLTYTYQQQLFFGNPSMTFDSGQTVGQVLATEFLSFTAESHSGTVYPGANNIGATMNLDPINPLLTLSTILGGMSTAEPSRSVRM